MASCPETFQQILDQRTRVEQIKAKLESLEGEYREVVNQGNEGGQQVFFNVISTEALKVDSTRQKLKRKLEKNTAKLGEELQNFCGECSIMVRNEYCKLCTEALVCREH